MTKCHSNIPGWSLSSLSSPKQIRHDLVGGLVAIFGIFPHGNVIIPIDFHIFQRGSNHQPVMLKASIIRLCFFYVLFHRRIDRFPRNTPCWRLSPKRGGHKKAIGTEILSRRFIVIQFYNSIRRMKILQTSSNSSVL